MVDETTTTEPQYLGVLPLVQYRYPWELLAERRYYGGNAMFQIWHPAYSVWTFSLKKAGGHVVDAVLEMAGIGQMLYDFCGGVLTSSPYIGVFEVPEFDPRSVWAKNWRRGWSAYTLGNEFPPTDRSKSQVANETERQKLFSLLPDSESFIGPGPFTMAQIREIGAKSIFGYLAAFAGGSMRRGIFGADRYSRDTELRDVLRIGVKNLQGWFCNVPRVGFFKHGSGERIAARSTASGNKREWQHCFTPGNYTPGRRYRNANSGASVSMTGAILPDIWRDRASPQYGVAEALARCSTTEWMKMSTEWYAGLMPLDLLHNG
jgi:hypothetical protein